MQARLVPVALFGMLAVQSGCASRLDFDSVSAGHDAGGDLGGMHDAGSTLEDGGAGEVASPASDAGPDGATFSCANIRPMPDFCADFESNDALSEWGPVIVEPEAPQPAGSIDLDDRAARTGHGSLLAVVNPAVSVCADCDFSVCVQEFFYELQGHRQLSIEFDMRVEQIDSHAGRRSMLFQFSFGTPERGFSQHTLQLQSSGETVEAAFIEYDTDEQVAGSDSAPSVIAFNHDWQPGPRLQDWVHVQYLLDAVDSDGSGNTLRLSVGDVVLIDGLLHFGLRYREPIFELGIPYVDTADFSDRETNESWQVRYDNVLVRSEPR